MYFAEAEEIFGYWEQSPPTYQLVGLIARMLGWEGPARELTEPPPMPEIDALMASEIGRAAGVPTPVVDLEAMREKNLRRVVEIRERQAARDAAKG
jgi:hypothetical protein